MVSKIKPCRVGQQADKTGEQMVQLSPRGLQAQGADGAGTAEGRVLGHLLLLEQLCAPVRPCTDWMRPTHILAGILVTSSLAI